MTSTVRTAIYLRQSLDIKGEEKAVSRQREACLQLAADRGWEVAEEYVDNNISASDSRKIRPGYDKMATDYAGGRFDALICWDLDRLTRQPRQLEDWIDAAGSRGLLIVTANGEADLATDAGQMFAGIKAQVARAEVRRKSARQRLAQRQRANDGKPPSGVRLTGYTQAGEVDEEEAEVVRRVFNGFAAGDTLKGIARSLSDDRVATRRGGEWSASTVSSILRNPRYAGRSVYGGEVVAKGQWPELVSEPLFDAVQARLTDPRRTVNRADTARKHVGSGVYRCECGLPVRSSSGLGGGMHRYTCRNMCFYRSGRPIDAYVLAVVRGRLALPDLAGLLVQEADKDALAGLNRQQADLRHRLTSIEADYDAGLIDGRRYATAVAKVTAQQDAIQRRAAALVTAEGPTSVLGAADPVAAFDAAPLAIRQRVIDTLASVTLHPGRHGSRSFDPATVTIAWRSA